MNEQAVELSREDLLRRYGKRPAPAAAGSERRSPFKFLDSYDVDDADIFFGRDVEIEELLRHFHSYGHVLIYGESGTGKSSLVQCGLRARIPAADALFIPLRVHSGGLPTVCREIGEYASRALGEAVDIAPQWGLVDTLRAAREAASRPIVLFFDQFEELFLFHDADTRQQFAEDLAAILKARLNVKVIIGIRQDFLAYLSELEDTVEGLFDNRFWLRRMSRENAAAAAVNACHTCGVQIEEALAAAIIHRLDPAGQGIELPYLQVVMDRLYRQAVAANADQPAITAAAVEELGDIAHILGTFLAEEVEKLPSPDTGRQMLKAFVTRAGTRRTLDRTAVGQEAAGFGAEITAADLDAHLNQLVNVRILREVAETESFELRHDALAATVSSWISEVEKELIEVRDNLVHRYQEFTARGQDSAALLDGDFLQYLAIYRHRLDPLLDTSLREFLKQSERHESRMRRRKRIALVTGVSVAFFVVLAFSVAVFVQMREAKNSLELARQAQQARTEAQVETLRTANPANVPFIIDSLDHPEFRSDVSAMLDARLAEGNLEERLRLQAAWLMMDPSRPELDEELAKVWQQLQSVDAAEFLAVVQALESYKDRLAPILKRRAQSVADDRFRAACGLAIYDPTNALWGKSDFCEDVVEELFAAKPLELRSWTEALREVGAQLRKPLQQRFERRDNEIERSTAAYILADLFRDDVPLLVNQILVAEPDQLPNLLRGLTDQQDSARTKLGEIPETELDTRARANLAVALLSLDDYESVRKHLKSSDDNTVRTETIHTLGPAEVDPRILINYLRSEKDPSVLGALLLSLGEYDNPTVLSSELRNSLDDLLSRIYREQPHHGVHSAVRWLCHEWNKEELLELDAEFAEYRPDRLWYVTREGHGMAVIFMENVRGTGVQQLLGGLTVESGPPDDDADQPTPYTLAISTEEVTVRQFENFLKAQEKNADSPLDRQIAPTDDCPIHNVGWLEAAEYCNWLSRKEGLKPFYPDKLDYDLEYGQADVLGVEGYRLPTALEWEIANRAGTGIITHFGNRMERAAEYAWSNQDAAGKSWPVGSRKPNEFGLFDTLGNVAEWCLDREPEDVPDRVLIGGSFESLDTSSPLTFVALRELLDPAGYPDIGFRVARTILP